MDSLADAIVLQNLSVLTRGNTLRPQGAAARRPEHLPPGHPGGLAPAHPADLEGARLRVPEGRRPHERLIFVPENAQYYAAFGAVQFGLYEEAGVGRYRGIENLRELHHDGRKAKLGAGGRAPRSRTPDELEAFKERYKHPAVRARDVRARAGRARRSSASTAARPRPRPCSSTRTATSSRRLPALQGQPDPGHQGDARRPRATGRRPGRDARGHGLRRHRLRRATSSRTRCAPTSTSSRPSRT